MTMSVSSEDPPISKQACLFWLQSFGHSVSNVEGCSSGPLISTLILELTGEHIGLTNEYENNNFEEETSPWENILKFLKREDINLKLDPKAILDGNVKEITRVLWLICLHFDIHSQERAAYQRTIRLGKRFMLDWIADEIKSTHMHEQEAFVSFFADGALLQDLVFKYNTDYNKSEKQDALDALRSIFDAVESKWGIQSNLVSPESIVDGTVNEITLLVYLTILRRKILKENKSLSPAKGPGSESILRNAPPTDSLETMSEGNTQAQKPLPVFSSDHSPDHGQSFDLKDFFAKLQTSPRVTNAERTVKDESNASRVDDKDVIKPFKEADIFSPEVLRDLAMDQERLKRHAKILQNEIQAADSKGFGVSQNDDPIGQQMSWKSDLHGFYQTSKNRTWMLEFEDKGFEDNVEEINHSTRRWYELKDKDTEDNTNDAAISIESGHENESEPPNVQDFDSSIHLDFYNRDALLERDQTGVTELQNNPNSVAQEHHKKEFAVCDAVFQNVPQLTIQPPTPNESDGSDNETFVRETMAATEKERHFFPAETFQTNGHSDFFEEPQQDLGTLDDSIEDSFSQLMTQNDNAVNCSTSQESRENVSLIQNQNDLGKSVLPDEDLIPHDRDSQAISSSADNDNAVNMDHFNHLTNWSEQSLHGSLAKYLDQEFENDDAFSEDRQPFSPTTTWKSSMINEESKDESGSHESAVDNADDILQTSIASTNELRALLEQSMLKNAEIDDVDEHNEINANVIRHLEMPGHYSMQCSDPLSECLEDIQHVGVLKARDLEEAKLESIRDLRIRMEECCDGVPIEKIPALVYKQWKDHMNNMIEDNENLSRESEEKRDELLREMRAELNILANENLALTKTVTDFNHYKFQNDLLQKQLNGLESFVSSLENSIHVKAKENEDISCRLASFQDEISAKNIELDSSRNDYEQELSKLRNSVVDSEKINMKLAADLKLKDIECKKLINDLNEIKNQCRSDLQHVQADSVGLRNNVTELLKQNEALKTANEADQTIIKHLEAKMKNFEDEVLELSKSKEEILLDLEQSRIRENSLVKNITSLNQEKDELFKEKKQLINKAEVIENEKMTLSRELNSKMSHEMQSTEAILGELRSLESSLNSVRNEKALVEEKYNVLKFENERLQRNLEIVEKKKKQVNCSHFNRIMDLRSLSRNSDISSLADTLPDSDIESLESYASFPASARRVLDISVKSPMPDVYVVKSNEKTPVINRNSQLTDPAQNSNANGSLDSERDGKVGQQYSVDDTRSWLRNMETKLEQTDKILRSVKKTRHVRV